MATRFLQNFYHWARVMKHDLASGPVEEMPRDQMPPEGEAGKAPGVYVRRGGHFCGVFPTPEGPVFFVDANTFPLRKGAFGIRVEVTGESEKAFVLLEDRSEQVRLDYRTDRVEEYDHYSGGQEDFFDWLAGMLDKDHFFSLYTV